MFNYSIWVKIDSDTDVQVLIAPTEAMICSNQYGTGCNGSQGLKEGHATIVDTIYVTGSWYSH